MNNRAQELVEQLGLLPHPEGGFYASMYRSEEKIKHHCLPNSRWNGDRPLYSSIYYLITEGNGSFWHRIASDEMWHFYEGSPIEISMIHSDGTLSVHRMGDKNGKLSYQFVVPGGVWFSVKCTAENGYALTGCSLAPGFDFGDFEMADIHQLSAQYPQHRELF